MIIKVAVYVRKTKKEKERVERPKRGGREGGLREKVREMQKGRGRDEKMGRVKVG